MPRDRPNVVLIYTDDQDQERVGAYGGLPTPNIDRIAEEGTRFDRFYVSSPVCVPSRYTALTGRYASRSEALGAEDRNIDFRSRIYSDTHTLASVLSSAGYATGMAGKWHLGDDEELEDVSPESEIDDPETAARVDRNYDRTVEGIEDTGFDRAASAYVTNPSNVPLPGEMRHHNMDWVTQGAVDFVEDHHDEPFFLYVAPTLTHGPWGLDQLATDPRNTPAGRLEDAPDVQPARESVRERVRERGLVRGRRGHGFEVGATTTWLDDGIGVLLDRLDELGLAEDTLVLFASDNGDIRGKGSLYDRGARMPLLARWPAGFGPRGPCDRLVSNADIAPTIMDVTGVDPPADYHTDGRSIRPLLDGDGDYRRESLYLEMRSSRGIVTDRYKYIAVRHPPEIEAEIEDGARFTHGGRRLEYDTAGWHADVDFPHYFDHDQLYDLREDPNEQQNLVDDPQYAGTLDALRGRLQEQVAATPLDFEV
jgi:arylsulfatase A-like enzyme